VNKTLHLLQVLSRSNGFTCIVKSTKKFGLSLILLIQRLGEATQWGFSNYSVATSINGSSSLVDSWKLQLKGFSSLVNVGSKSAALYANHIDSILLNVGFNYMYSRPFAYMKATHMHPIVMGVGWVTAKPGRHVAVGKQISVKLFPGHSKGLNKTSYPLCNDTVRHWGVVGNYMWLTQGNLALGLAKLELRLHRLSGIQLRQMYTL
jgi:hypothetical protein